MSKKIEDYLHLYIGCEALVSSKMEYIEKAEEFCPALSGYINEKFPDIQKIKWQAHEMSFFSPKYVKLLLRPLSDMTEEEKSLLGEILDPGKEYEDDYNGYSYSFYDVGKSFVECLLKDQIEDEVPFKPSRFIKAINECRQLSFDMDGLIESGLAIDKTKTQ